mmetsp:Transcript_20209/g.9363  ORF Transcript_20209/g.9363 Transcript_20209/m.9363 type:complete len:123 (+) Transcript_20209:57-425(+)
METLGKILEVPAYPMVVILGGVKMAEKFELINNLLDKCTDLIVGGGLAFTFKKLLENTEIGSSVYDEEGAKMIQDIISKAYISGVSVHLPWDFRCGDGWEEGCEVKDADHVPEGWVGLDIGP